jgi:hypothetical protein
MGLSQMGKTFAQSGYFQDAKDAFKAIVKIQAGQELGIPPVAAMTTIHVIKGKPSLGAQAIAALIKKSEKYDYRIREMSGSICTVEMFEKINGKYESIGKTSFTEKDAKRAGTGNMSKFPRNMLFARCISNAVKWYAPDLIITGCYTPEELSGGQFDTDENGEPVYAEAEVIEEIPQEKIDRLMELAEILGYEDQFRNSWIDHDEKWIDRKIAKAENMIAEKKAELDAPAEDADQTEDQLTEFPDEWDSNMLFQLVQNATDDYYNHTRHMKNALKLDAYPQATDKGMWIKLYDKLVLHAQEKTK